MLKASPSNGSHTTSAGSPIQQTRGRRSRSRMGQAVQMVAKARPGVRCLVYQSTRTHTHKQHRPTRRGSRARTARLTETHPVVAVHFDKGDILVLLLDLFPGHLCFHSRVLRHQVCQCVPAFFGAFPSASLQSETPRHAGSEKRAGRVTFTPSRPFARPPAPWSLSSSSSRAVVPD